MRVLPFDELVKPSLAELDLRVALDLFKVEENAVHSRGGKHGIRLRQVRGSHYNASASEETPISLMWQHYSLQSRPTSVVSASIRRKHHREPHENTLQHSREPL